MPPFVVRIIIPESPAIHPVFEFMNEMSVRFFVVGLSIADQKSWEWDVSEKINKNDREIKIIFNDDLNGLFKYFDGNA